MFAPPSESRIYMLIASSTSYEATEVAGSGEGREATN